jgi:DNA-binding beta-propeller fold protein YncE
VADFENHRVQKFDRTGAFLTQWGTRGAGDGQFVDPFGVAIDPAGHVFVTDYGNHRVQKFTSTGSYLTQWGTAGNGDGQFRGPVGVAIDAAGNIFVADSGNHRIQKFAPDDTPTITTTWGRLKSLYR